MSRLPLRIAKQSMHPCHSMKSSWETKQEVSGLKQNCAEYLTPFSGRIFHALSHGMICFVPTGGPRNHPLTVPRLDTFHWAFWCVSFLIPNHTLEKSLKICARKECQKLCTAHFCSRSPLSPYIQLRVPHLLTNDPYWRKQIEKVCQWPYLTMLWQTAFRHSGA